MKMIHLFPVILVMSMLNTASYAFFVNNGAVTSIEAGAVLFANGSIINQNNGVFDNAGTIRLTENWTNNAGNNAFASATGTVIFQGASQTISGTSITHFNNLSLEGTGIKYLNTDAVVNGSLALNDRELSTDVNTLFLTNTSVSAITRTTGFVSSLGSGTLSRATNSVSVYLFPVGSSSGTFRYRPVEIAPVSAASHTFSVRFANVDASSEGFDRNQNDFLLCSINPEFYHRINRTSGSSPADITIYFDSSVDDNFTTIAHWQNVPRWENIAPVNSVSNYGLSGLKKVGWNDFLYPAFALATTLQSCGKNKVLICHIPTDNPSDAHDICVNPNAAQAHFAHGDQCGPCQTPSFKTNNSEQTASEYGESQYSLLNTQISLSPNPFRDKTNIRFSLPEKGNVTIEVFDVTGKTLGKIFDSAIESDALYSAEFNAVGLPDGVYFYKITASQESYWGKMALMK